METVHIVGIILIELIIWDKEGAVEKKVEIIKWVPARDGSSTIVCIKAQFV